MDVAMCVSSLDHTQRCACMCFCVDTNVHQIKKRQLSNVCSFKRHSENHCTADVSLRENNVARAKLVFKRQTFK